jgi:TetR/AcrR family transcriptional regulator, fatty acid metabolism regulator protein
MAYRKTKETEERKEAKQRMILDVATKLFGNCGYHTTTVPMILAEADISSGCFYTYFRNKEDVFNAALEALGRAIVCVIDNVNQSQSDPLKRIPQGAEALFLFLAENPKQARILIIESSGLSPRIETTRRAILLELEVRLRRIFESSPSLFSVRNATVTARCIAGATFEAAYCWLDEDPKTRLQAAEVARVVAHFNTRAVKKMIARHK